MKLRVLDLFCGAGGAAKGYHDGFIAAGFDVEIVGVDIEPQPDYPYRFVHADAMAFTSVTAFDFVHASPPCQGESVTRSLHPDKEYDRPLIPTFERLAALSCPWVVENVDNAAAPSSVYKARLCGSSFGLRTRRHRWFWSNLAFLVSPCDHRAQGVTLGVYGNSDGAHEDGFKHPGRKRGPRQATTVEAREIMGMPWVTKRHGLTQAIPPAYTEFLAGQIAPALVRGAA